MPLSKRTEQRRRRAAVNVQAIAECEADIARHREAIDRLQRMLARVHADTVRHQHNSDGTVTVIAEGPGGAWAGRTVHIGSDNSTAHTKA